MLIRGGIWMQNELKILLDSELLKKFDIALILNNENKDEVIDMLLKSYVSRTFSQAAALYENEKNSGTETEEYYGKALHKIPKWAKKPKQAIYKIIRAYFQLSDNGAVTYTELAQQCSDSVNHSDVYMPSFSTNFAQMKFDGEKSYGKVFEVNKDGTVTIWSYVEAQLLKYKNDFMLRSTDEGYVNDNNQRNIGKTNEKGTDFGQYLYMMHCDDCGHEYFANGSDIHLKKCPKCQGGADTGVDM